jgi:hypothetical protein
MTPDPVTGNERPGAVVRQFNVPARLSQSPVANLGSQIELLANSQTVVSMWTVLVGRSASLTSDSVVIDGQGRKFRIEGAVADRPAYRPTFKAAAARLISDMQ